MKLTRSIARKHNITIRPLAREELDRLHEPRAKLPAMVKIRDSHHRLARLFAMGLRVHEIVERSGYSYQRLAAFDRDPAFQELVAQKRKLADESFIAAADEYHSVATRNMLAAERHIADHIDQLDSEGELLPVKTALAISRDAADRFGYGKKQTNLNVNVDFAKNLESMLRRSGKGGTVVRSSPLSPVVDAVPLTPLADVSPARPLAPQPQAASDSGAGEATFKRRAIG